MARDVAITLSFDMRSPEWGAPTADLYRTAIDMAAFGDGIGVDRIGLMEHHGSDDGYLPQPFVLASAMAAVTERARFMLGAVILPLHDPVMIAEKIALVDLISKGRLNVIFGAGYVPFEFAMFGKSLKDRGKLLDSHIELILRALNGERFEMNDKPVFVRPLPVQRPEEIVLVGGGVPASARRAARFGVGFGPMKAELIPLYEEECAKLGRKPGFYSRPKAGMPLAIHLCEDPEAGWKAIERHAVHVITEYAKWAEQEGDASSSPFKGLDNPAVLKQAGLFACWTPEQLIAQAAQMEDKTSLGLQPLLGGLDPEEGWKSLRLLEQAMPDLRAAFAR
ncbi:LLM class flavin-dependent oxidoreductase [Novosphingobium sp. TH158]|uniref:LLM class flavin-dependent oxidoreductase n=1 Tax=Novosphingobium sp. TH158 TaxID=2067455 RepID=UPI000C7D805C|nr:LLM class flavin-dependent oxidoreductase [Novosphingobium sp. TH158]PLK26458.1 LLM class flavin-dependent oxidoreductase [Novosphingobium sp. TH158]